MAHRLLESLLAIPPEVVMTAGTVLFLCGGFMFFMAHALCRSCGKSLKETARTETFTQIAGRWIHHRHTLELCDNPNCRENIRIRTKSRPATGAELQHLRAS